MIGDPTIRIEPLFHVGFSLEDRVPADHLLRRIHKTVDLSFVRGEVAHLYGRNGHKSLDPELVIRLMLLLFLENVASERELMRQLPMRLDWLWFCGLGLDSVIPNHSVLSKARRRWGTKLFESLFDRVLKACDDAGLVGGGTVHVDSTLLKANACRDGRVSRRLWEQLENGLDARAASSCDESGIGDANADVASHDAADDADDDFNDASGEPAAQSPERSERATRNRSEVSPTDPDAAIHTRRGVGTILGYRDHRLVDNMHGIVIVTHVTPADGDDGAQVPLLLEGMERRIGTLPDEIVGDSQYGTRDNYELCAARGVKAYLKKRRGKSTPRVSWLRLLPETCSASRALHLMGRRRTVAEGSFAEAHTRMDHRRCRWRRKSRVQLQAYLVATVQNIKKLVKGVSRRPVSEGMQRPIGLVCGQIAAMALVFGREASRILTGFVCAPARQ